MVTTVSILVLSTRFVNKLVKVGFQMVTTMNVQALTDWILDEAQHNYEGSIRRLAEHCGLSHATLVRFMNQTAEEPRAITLNILDRLARGTDTDLCSLITLLFPDSAHVDAEIIILAGRIARLPPDKQEQVDAFILGLTLKGVDEGG